MAPAAAAGAGAVVAVAIAVPLPLLSLLSLLILVMVVVLVFSRMRRLGSECSRRWCRRLTLSPSSARLPASCLLFFVADPKTLTDLSGVGPQVQEAEERLREEGSRCSDLERALEAAEKR